MRDRCAHGTVEYDATKVSSRAGAGRAILHLALVCFGVGDEFLEVAYGQIGPGNDRNRRHREIGNRREVSHHIVEGMFIERLILRMGADATEHHRVTVRLRICDAFRTGHAAGATNVLDDYLLAEQFAHALGNDAADGVLRSASGERDDHRYGACWEILGGGRSGQSQYGKGRGDQNLFHCCPPPEEQTLAPRATMVKRSWVVWLNRPRQLSREIRATGRRVRWHRLGSYRKAS